ADVKDAEQKARALVLVGRAQAKAGEREPALETFRRAFQIADILANDGPNDFLVRGGVLMAIIQAQADAGDTDGARKTLQAMRKPKAAEADPPGALNTLTQFWENGVAAGRVTIAVGQARAGKTREAAETTHQIDDQH